MWASLVLWLSGATAFVLAVAGFFAALNVLMLTMAKSADNAGTLTLSMRRLRRRLRSRRSSDARKKPLPPDTHGGELIVLADVREPSRRTEKEE
jgi:hypothetical protein